MEALDAEKLAAELGADFVYLNPTPQSARRFWVTDELWVYNSGKTVVFHGVKATWMASASQVLMKGMLVEPYTPAEIYQESHGRPL